MLNDGPNPRHIEIFNFIQENDSVFMYTKKKRNEAVQEKA